MRLCTKTAVIVIFLAVLLSVSLASAGFSFSDTRFQNLLTTENLDAIIDEYELFDGWYWTTPSDVMQDFHGHPDSPGWNTTVDQRGLKGFLPGWYGCRWPIDHVRKTSPDKGGYAECFAFAQFIGYLLSGDINPQHHWDFYYSLESSSGLKVGDIVRTEYRKRDKQFQHSAVVYAVNGEEILFMQVSGGSYNKISVGKGFTDGYVFNATTEKDISSLPGLKISRYNHPDE